MYTTNLSEILRALPSNSLTEFPPLQIYMKKNIQKLTKYEVSNSSFALIQNFRRYGAVKNHLVTNCVCGSVA